MRFAPLLLAITVASCVDLSGAAQGGDSPADGGTDASAPGDDSAPPHDAATNDGGATVRASCATPGPGVSDCGPMKNEDCCASALVTGGVFFRAHDGVINFDTAHPAQVSSFALDRFEITVGRFRRFVDAVAAGFTPAAGSGKHTHLAGGSGLAGAGGANEQGWDPAWTALLPKTVLDWSNKLACHVTLATWSLSPGTREAYPINCVDWLEAYAFCIWDDGFLPSEAEIGYAESGGAEQRVYPWSVPPTSTTIDCSYVNASGCGSPPDSAPVAVGSRSPKGDGRFGHADLAGNMNEWALDVFVDPLANPCTDCAVFTGGANRVTHGGGYFNPNAGISAALRSSAPGRDYALGARCAHSK